MLKYRNGDRLVKDEENIILAYKIRKDNMNFILQYLIQMRQLVIDVPNDEV